MFWNFYLVLVLSLFGCPEMVKGSRGRIVNGSQALEGEFPFMLSLRRYTSGRHLCGASVINSGWALTAAHCVAGTFAARINVQYGSNRLEANSTSVVNVSKIFTHEGYMPHNQYIHDIALLKLKTPLALGAKVRAIRLPEMEQVTAENETATLIGWGLNAVSLRHISNSAHFCAGTIINESWILTGAHCFTYIESPQQLILQVGSNYLRPKNPILKHITKIIKHEGYNPTVAIHDIALLKLSTPLLEGSQFKPVKLINNNDSIVTNSNATLIGWGLEKTDGSLQARLQQVKLRVLSSTECRSKLPAFVHAQNICAFYKFKGQCSGDSGGPLLLDDYQIGIVSWSLKPCGLHPGVFTNIKFYENWINEIISIE